MVIAMPEMKPNPLVTSQCPQHWVRRMFFRKLTKQTDYVQQSTFLLFKIAGVGWRKVLFYGAGDRHPWRKPVARNDPTKRSHNDTDQTRVPARQLVHGTFNSPSQMEEDLSSVPIFRRAVISTLNQLDVIT